MKKYALIDSAGKFLQIAIPSDDDMYQEGATYNGLLCISVPLDSDDFDLIENHYYKNGLVNRRPSRPSAFHYWNPDDEAWLPDFDAAIVARQQDVSHELRRRLYLPCNGFDADKVSRERIGGMIARLQRGDGLPAGWVGWRDAQNQMHWQEETAAVVLHNLTSLARCIEDREQALLVASWQHKANIAALTDIDSIIGYDVTAGWPT